MTGHELIRLIEGMGIDAHHAEVFLIDEETGAAEPLGGAILENGELKLMTKCTAGESGNVPDPFNEDVEQP